MKATVHIPDELAQRAGTRYHKAKRADYSMGELVRVGLELLELASLADIRARVPKSTRTDHTPRRPDIPGLTQRSQYRPPESGYLLGSSG